MLKSNLRVHMLNNVLQCTVTETNREKDRNREKQRQRPEQTDRRRLLKERNRSQRK